MATRGVDERTFHVTTEHVPPRVELSGPATQPVNPGPQLRIDTTDRIDETDGTGVQSIEVLVDGVREHLYERDCPAAGCPQDFDVDHVIDSSRYSEGLHQLQVVAKDVAGNIGTSASASVYVTQLGAIDRSKLGLEDFLHYHSTQTGAGSRLHVNAHTGNVVWHSVPVVNPGRGLSTVVNLTYNSHDRGGVIAEQMSAAGSPVLGASLSDLVGLAYGEAGHGFSIGVSGLTRLNEPLAGAPTAMATGRIVMTDPDGTAHTFTDATATASSTNRQGSTSGCGASMTEPARIPRPAARSSGSAGRSRAPTASPRSSIPPATRRPSRTATATSCCSSTRRIPRSTARPRYGMRVPRGGARRGYLRKHRNEMSRSRKEFRRRVREGDELLDWAGYSDLRLFPRSPLN